MKKLALLLVLSIPAFGQVAQFTAPDCQFGFNYQVLSSVITAQPLIGGTRTPASGSANTLAGYDNRNQVCTTWSLMYNTEGVSGVSIELDGAPSSAGIPGSWTVWPAAQVALGGVLPLTTTSQGNVTVFTYQPFVSVILNSATGTGSVYGRVVGWKPAPGTDVASGNTPVVGATSAADPCASSGVKKQSAPINISTATTTALVAVSGTTVVYVCSYSMSINSVVTTATTAQLEYGTGGTCGGSTVALTGLYGGGGVTAGIPFAVSQMSPLKPTPAANAVCLVSAGATVQIQGVLTYVQQ